MRHKGRHARRAELEQLRAALVQRAARLHQVVDDDDAPARGVAVLHRDDALVAVPHLAADDDGVAVGVEHVLEALRRAVVGELDSYELNIKIFNHFQNTITGWPGGKPNADDSTRPERKSPNPKRVIIFSPHPDDDVVSMGGTFDRLVSQGHDVHVAYQTSGNIAVSDHDALKFLEVSKDVNEIDKRSE